jgi:nicotinamide-nucleotide amidase
VCFCLTTSDGMVLARDPQLPGGRSDVRERSTDLAMNLLLKALRARE